MNKEITESKLDRILKYIFIFGSISIGLYPLAYTIVEYQRRTLLATKPDSLLSNITWRIGFYLHIFPSGIALLTGLPQFFPSLRSKYMKIHRICGYVYFIAVLIGGISACSISFSATGGSVAGSGFFILGSLWIISTSISIYNVTKK
jgi:hypothetical protein